MGEMPNQTSSVAKMVIGSNLVVINGYSAAKGIGVGKYIASDEFTVGGYKFVIYIYPHGKNPEVNPNSVCAYVGLAMATEDESRDMQVMSELTLMDQSGKGNHLVRSCFDSPLLHTNHNRMCGYRGFFKKDSLEMSDYFRDDCLKIYCTVRVAVSAIECSRLHFIQVPDCDREMVEMPDRTLKQTSQALLCSVTETMGGSNLFTIKGYSVAKGVGSGKHIVSNEFSVGGYKWAIHFYPDGRNPKDLTYVSVFIALASEGRDVRALFELTLMDQSGKGKHKVHSCFDQALPKLLKMRGSMWGYMKYIKKAELEMSDYLRDDCLKIYCTVGVVPAIDCSRFRLIHVPDSDVGLHIGMLLENKESCDITFNVSGDKFHAHKLILAARSPKLLSELHEGVNTEEIMVPDMEPKVFKALLHFIYTDGLAENELIASTPLVAYTLTAALLAAADRYDLERLRRLCESHLCKYITVDSVIQVQALADRCHAAELKDVCLTFAARNSTAVMRGDGFEYLEENWSSLKSELPNSVGGCDEDCSNSGGESESVLALLPDGGDISGRRVRQRTEEIKADIPAELELECVEF